MTKNKTASGLIRSYLGAEVDAQHGGKRDRGDGLQREPAAQVAPDPSKSVTGERSEGRGGAYKRKECLKFETNGADPAAAAPVERIRITGSMMKTEYGYVTVIGLTPIEPAAGSGRPCCIDL